MKKNVSITSDKTEINSDSDSEESKSWELPNFFEDKNFYIYGTFEPNKRKLIERSIIGFAG